VPAALSLYERVGFRRICRSFRFIGPLRGQPHPGVRVMHASDMPAVAALDQAAFGADRRFFLERRLALYPELCWVLEEREEVVGFIMGRYGRGGISAGPWIVRPGLPQPERLLQSFALAAPGVDLVVGALDNNPEAVAALRALGLEEYASSPWRMALGPDVPFGAPDQIYAIGSAAKG
jgi:hypothetical protein